MNALNVVFDKALKEDIVYAYYAPNASRTLLVRAYTNEDENNILVTAPDVLNSWIAQSSKLVNHLSGMRKTLVFGTVPLSALADTLSQIKPEDNAFRCVSFNINGVMYDDESSNIINQPIQVIIHVASTESSTSFEPSFKTADGTAIEDLSKFIVSGEIRVWYLGLEIQE